MATIILQAAGAFLGGFLGSAGGALGAAAGSIAGYLVDRSILMSSVHHRGPRLQQMRPFNAEEGTPMARVFGTARVAGTLIWATRFEEARRTHRQGFKGGPKTTEYSYYGNVAFGLCEGPIAGVRRVWADGRELDLTLVEMRVHTGSDDQQPDPLVEAKQGEGNAPAYRGTAYVVLERLPLDAYGNRIPQLHFEVMRPPAGFADRIRAITLIPGSTDFGLETRRVTRSPRRGATEDVNRHVLHGATDLEASLDELEKLCPNLASVALVVTWFGDDLRAGECRIRPMVTPATGQASRPWIVSGETPSTAAVVSQFQGHSAYGGTPSDDSVIAAIAAIKSRGWKVAFYPFIMMDVPADNELPDPYGAAAQPAYPWRGRITCHPAPGQPASADRSAEALNQIAAFCGSASPEDYSPAGSTVTYHGDPGDWGYRRMILHYAHLVGLADGVDSFLIGSEMRGITTLRDGEGAYPFVGQLVELATDVRGILGPETKLTYAADWSEYFGHQPADGTGDVFFHLDPLWAHDAIDAVGIDNYMTLSDWRDGDYAGGNPDGFASPYDAAGLRQGIASGEGFDWYYADAEARATRTRSPITDGSAGKPWVFRYKDLVAWWSNEHFDRPAGVESLVSTSWVPRSKPIWFTELGCAAVDKGPNQPNVFPDAKSSENGAPYFSNLGRSDAAQRSFIGAHIDHWDPASPVFVDAGNPHSDVYDGRMVDPEAIFLWAWDARPFPAFPLQTGSWSDGANWMKGHWLNGRLSGVTVGSIVGDILRGAGVTAWSAEACDEVLHGYVVEEPGPSRAALEPLVDLLDLAVIDRSGILSIRPARAVAAVASSFDDIVASEDDAAALEVVRSPDRDLPASATLVYRDPMSDYEAGTARSLHEASGVGEVSIGLPAIIEQGQAQSLIDTWLRRQWLGRDVLRFALPASNRDVAPGSLVEVGAGREYLVVSVDDGLVRTLEARRILRLPPAPERGTIEHGTEAPMSVGPPMAIFLDLPLAGEGLPRDQFRVAVAAEPWVTQQLYASPADEGYELRSTIWRPATAGRLTGPLAPGYSGRLDKTHAVEVGLDYGALASVSRLHLLNGANAAAIRSATGAWEVLQFETAEEVAPSIWRLQHLLRGQLGTEDAAEAGAEAGADFVLLDDAVQPAGLRDGEAGLALTWRAGPAGREFTDDFFVTSQEAGGIRALMPLRPVHLRAVWQADGSLRVTWIRRGRIGADNWLAVDIPLGEAEERYGVSVKSTAGALIRRANVAVAEWSYSAAEITADFPVPPSGFVIEVVQISREVGDGLAAVRSVDFP